MPRETFILTQDIAAGQIIDSHVDPASNLGKIAIKKVIDTLIFPGIPVSGMLTRLDLLLLDQPVAVLPTDNGILTTKQHALYKDGTANGLDDGSGQNRVRGSLATGNPTTSAVDMTMGSDIGIASVPSNFAVGDIVRIQGQGLIGPFLAEVGAIAGPNLTFVVPGTATPKTFVEGTTGTYNMERCRRWFMSWITAAMGAFAVPAASYTLGIFRRAYLSDINTLFAPATYPVDAEAPQLPGAGGGGGSVPTVANKNQTPLATVGDFQTTGLTISATPASGSYVRVSVNGVGQVLGDGVKTEDCYFSVDGGTTARPIASITAGDTLYWNGLLAGFNLAVTDVVDMEYNV